MRHSEKAANRREDITLKSNYYYISWHEQRNTVTPL